MPRSYGVAVRQTMNPSNLEGRSDRDATYAFDERYRPVATVRLDDLVEVVMELHPSIQEGGEGGGLWSAPYSSTRYE